jgi:hypothetical protein
MAEQRQQKSLQDRLRELLENLDKLLKPMPQAPQPIPVKGTRPKE